MDGIGTKDGRASALSGYAKPEISRWRKPLGMAVIVVAALALISGIAGFAYWRSLSNTPQYSLALIVDAAKRGDTEGVNRLVDMDAVVDDFVPQVTGKAGEIYGRGISPAILKQMEKIATPILPAVKDRAKIELPRVIRERTDKYGNVPFAAMVLGADRYLDIQTVGETAVIKSKLGGHQLEMTMRRSGNVWKIIAVKDDILATEIAQRVGQEIVAIATNGGVQNTADNVGTQGLIKLLRDAEELLR